MSSTFSSGERHCSSTTLHDLIIVTMATITGVTKSMITAIMTIITLVTITSISHTRVGMNDQQQLEFTSLAVYFSKNLSYLAKLVS